MFKKQTVDSFIIVTNTFQMIALYFILLIIVASLLYSLFYKIKGNTLGCISTIIIVYISILISNGLYYVITGGDNLEARFKNKNKTDLIKEDKESHKPLSNKLVNQKVNSKENYTITKSTKVIIENNSNQQSTTNNNLYYYIDDDSDYYNDDSDYYENYNETSQFKLRNENQQHYQYLYNTDDFKSKVRIGAVCNDGTYSTATGRGACSHHGGVAYWVYE